MAKNILIEEGDRPFKCSASVDGLMQMSEAIVDVICEEEPEPCYDSEPLASIANKSIRIKKRSRRRRPKLAKEQAWKRGE